MQKSYLNIVETTLFQKSLNFINGKQNIKALKRKLEQVPLSTSPETNNLHVIATTSEPPKNSLQYTANFLTENIE